VTGGLRSVSPGGTLALPARALSHRTARSGVSADVAAAIVVAAVLFNIVLCFVDTNVMRLSSGHVMLVEGLVLAAALLVPLAQSPRAPGRLHLLLILLFASWLLLSILRQSIEPKYFRDVAIIPIFVLLGLATRGEQIHRRLFWLHMTIVLLALWEALSVQSFVSVFSIADYFSHTRGLLVDEWWVDSGLYLSAVRPEARFLLADLPLHRLSSVFLEPVSFGNYVVIATIWLAGFWHRIPHRMRMVGAVTTLLLLVGSDSRMATVSGVAILLAVAFRRFIPSAAPLLVAPLVVAAMFLGVHLLDLRSGIDNFEGRIAHAVEVFRAFDLDHYAGLSLSFTREAEDAGFAYIIMTQSLLGAAFLWTIVFFRRLRTAEARYVHLAVALYVALNLTVSWSLFSIKSAALLWFLLGLSIANDQPEGEQERKAKAPVPPATP
jgi:putative polymerase